MKTLSPSIHGILDYAAALALIVAPYVLGLTGVALWLSVAAGVGLIGYSLLTRYAYSLFKVIPFNIHIAFDTLAGLVFVAVPFALEITAVAQIYYWVMGSGVLAVVILTNKNEATQAQIQTAAGQTAA